MNKIIKKSTVLLLIAALLIIPFEATVFASEGLDDSDPALERWPLIFYW